MSQDVTEPEDSSLWSESLRERKKRLTRSLISDSATAMFLERGFDDVKVADIAEACGVSQKTVYNYFPTKESLLFDREPEIAVEIWRILGPGSSVPSPVTGMLELLKAEREGMYGSGLKGGTALFRRFAELIDSTPSLAAAMRDMSDRLERTTAEALAEQAGVGADEPEPRVAAAALIALWRIQFDALRKCALEERTLEATLEMVTAEVQRAARVVESGLWWFGAMAEGRQSRQQMKAAADAAVLAGRQVVTAIRQARAVFEQMHREAGHPHDHNEFGFQGLASFLEETARWKRDMLGHQVQWKQAYREEQARLREAQRNLARSYRKGGPQRHQAGRRRDTAGPSSSESPGAQP